jgi:hypothetical protein
MGGNQQVESVPTFVPTMASGMVSSILCPSDRPVSRGVTTCPNATERDQERVTDRPDIVLTISGMPETVARVDWPGRRIFVLPAMGWFADWQGARRHVRGGESDCTKIARKLPDRDAEGTIWQQGTACELASHQAIQHWPTPTVTAGNGLITRRSPSDPQPTMSLKLLK